MVNYRMCAYGTLSALLFVGATAFGIGMLKADLSNDDKKFWNYAIGGTFCLGVNQFILDNARGERERRRDRIGSLYPKRE